MVNGVFSFSKIFYNPKPSGNAVSSSVKKSLAQDVFELNKACTIPFRGSKQESSMFAEIKEQPGVVARLADKYFPVGKPVQNVCLIGMSKDDIVNLSRIHIVASGSSKNVGTAAKNVFEQVAGIPVEVHYASEFIVPVIKSNELVVAISQSGETADTYEAVKTAKSQGAYTFAITNNPDSRIQRTADYALYVEAGQEKSIAATKSVMAQLINLYALALYLGEQKGTIAPDKARELKQELHLIPAKLDRFINSSSSIDKVAGKIAGGSTKSLVILGKGLNLGVAQEGALKIKETSYIDANAFPTGEFLHGYMAVIDKNIPVISILMPDKNAYETAVKNTELLVQKTNPDLIIIKSEADRRLESNEFFKNADFISIPETKEELSPIFTIVCAQMLALKTAELLGRDLKNPRNLSKVVK